MSIDSRQDVKEQYGDASNLNARSAIYRFGDATATPWPRWVFDQFAPALRRDAKVLEIGCGDGTLWRKNSDRLGRGWKVTLFDLSHGMLAAAANDLNAFRRVQGEAEALPFADERFDVVIANHMLYHVADRPRALSEIRRVLVPGGRLIAGTNSTDHMIQMKRLTDRFLPHARELFGHGTFVLENGGEQLRPHFQSVERRSVRGELRVTDATAVVNYMFSINDAPRMIVGDRLAELNEVVDREIATHGAYHFTTAAGVFIATKDSQAF